MSPDEVRLAKQWAIEDNMAASDISERLGRNKSTISRLLRGRCTRKQRGRKPSLSKKQVDGLVAKLNTMVKQADAQKEVTVDMLKRSARCKACTRTISKALHSRKIYFRRLTEKPTLTAQDMRDRIAFANKYAKKTGAWWQRSIQMHIDVKHFGIFLDGKGRRHVAQVGCRGAYRGSLAPFL